MNGLTQRSFWTEALLVIIMGFFLLSAPACGRKGDPVPPQPQQPKTGASAEQPQQPKTGTGADQQEKPPGTTPAK